MSPDRPLLHEVGPRPSLRASVFLWQPAPGLGNSNREYANIRTRTNSPQISNIAFSNSEKMALSRRRISRQSPSASHRLPACCLPLGGRNSQSAFIGCKSLKTQNRRYRRAVHPGAYPRTQFPRENSRGRVQVLASNFQPLASERRNVPVHPVSPVFAYRSTSHPAGRACYPGSSLQLLASRNLASPNLSGVTSQPQRRQFRAVCMSIYNALGAGGWS